MPLPGGAAGKIGDRYEVRWAVACALDVLDERAVSIRLEPPGDLGDRIEFFLRTNDGIEFHQSKRQQTGQGGWTINQLAREGVLSGFQQKLQAFPEAVCVFVSSHVAVRLHELAQRAKDAQSAQEFEAGFVSPNQTYSATFYELRRAWGDCSAEDAYNWLRRIRVRMLDEQGVQELVRARLSPLVDGHVDEVATCLFELMFDSVHQELTAAGIWRHLEAAGYRRRNWAHDPHVLASVTSTTDRYLQRLGRELIGGSSIPRAEALSVTDSLTYSGQKAIIVVGQAGQGKSAVLLQAVQELRHRGALVLALRLDELQPALTPIDLGRQLGLPGSPAAVLAALSRGSPAVLVIDQVDAVSLVSGRNVEFFDCIDDLIADTEHLGLSLLMACRKFDADNDHRIRRLSERENPAVELPVAPLSQEAVASVLGTLGVSAGSLKPAQLDLLSVPLHLRLFTEVAAASRPRAFDFRTVNDLYDRFWSYKQTVIEQVHLGRGVRWTEVVDALCHYMSEHQTLSAPAHVVDEWRTDAQAMISEHVLHEDGGQLGFFHEGFFDYAFARRFAVRNERLLDFLTHGEQHLFRRAQVRQVLAYERAVEFGRYVSDIKDLLLSGQVRFHIKQVVLSLLHSLTDSKREEWEVLDQLMNVEPNGPLGIEAWRTIDGSTNWFDLIDSFGVVSAWLAGSDRNDLDRAMWLLRSVQEVRADRVAELLEPFVGAGEEWDSRLLWLMQWCDAAGGERFFLLFLKLLDAGVLDSARGPMGDFWSLIDRFARREPARASTAIGHHLLNRLRASLKAGQADPFDSTSGTIPNSPHESLVFQSAASGAPLQFVREVLPFLLQVLTLGAVRRGDPPWQDRVWGYYGFEHGIENRLLIAMRQALASVASTDPSSFREFAGELKSLDLETADYLLFGGYAASPREFADEAAEYLIERPARLRASRLGQSHWEARRLIEAVTPHCSQETLGKLEEMILSYYPKWERSREGRQARGHAQFILLGGIDSERLSPAGAKRIQEWSRKFQEDAPRPPQPLEVMRVPPPIDESAAEKMSDEQWLKAMERYRGEYAGSGRFPYVGGAPELARVLEGVAQRQPERFAQLLLRLPDTARVAYFHAILRGITDAQLETEIVLNAVERCNALPDRPCGDSICRLIARIADRPLPPELLDTVSWHAVEDSDPKPGEWKIRGQDDDDDDFREPSRIFTEGINTARGSAARIMAHLIFSDRARGAYFLPALRRMVQDPSTAVRSCVATTLLAMLAVDRDVAVSLFVNDLCDTDEELLGTPDIYEFLRYASKTHLEDVLGTIERMTSFQKPRVARMGAQLVCLAALDQEDAAELSHLCLNGSEPQREGAAAVFAANLSSAHFRQLCEDALTVLYGDESEKVRSEAASCFRGFSDTELGEVRDLISKYVESQAFGSMQDSLIHALETTTARMPVEICAMCERFFDTAGAAAADISTHAAAEAHTITALLLRAYHQSDTPELQVRCLDLIDRMVQLRAMGFDKALASFDR